MSETETKHEAADAGREQSSYRVPSNLFPALTYRDAPAAIEWLCRAFGFTRRLVVSGPGDSIMHSELSFGPGVIMVSSIKPGTGRTTPLELPAVSQALSVCVEDVDAHYARAKEAGATIVDALSETKFGARGYGAQDPEGHLWFFADYAPGAYWEDAGDGAGA